MENARKINISDFIDNSKIGAFQVGLFTLCAMGLIIDGFDVQALGYVGPAVIEEMGMDTRQLGNVLAATNFGVLLGSLLFTMVGDEWGRRPVLIGATFFFGMMTILAGLSTTYQQLLVIRFIGGIGMGTVIPNATALIAEYSPRRMRVKLIMNITVGFTAGAALGGFVAARMIPTLGWRSVFYFGGAIPLLIGALMILYLPESLQFQVLKKGSLEGVRQSLKRIDPAAWVDASPVPAHAGLAQGPVRGGTSAPRCRRRYSRTPKARHAPDWPIPNSATMEPTTSRLKLSRITYR